MKRTSTGPLTFADTANGSTVDLGPFHDAHGHTYTVCWNIGSAPHRCLVNAGSGLVLGIQEMSTADNENVLQWSDTGTADHRWIIWPLLVMSCAGALRLSWGSMNVRASARAPTRSSRALVPISSSP
ncbi:RICIN domain-containing protein [Streptomyces sp. NPDC057253]|uniref:RICIN domain-containing protein n=1 Tax=Streptomyces sp. NPDC057253 TaxID=3346069 RepID=UPI003624B6DD